METGVRAKCLLFRHFLYIRTHSLLPPRNSTQQHWHCTAMHPSTVMPHRCSILAPLLIFLISSLNTPACSAAIARHHDTLMAGQVLAVGDKLVSRSGKFALGFFQPAVSAGTIRKSTANTTTSPGWYLGIWFNKIPVFTTVWFANRDKPIPDIDLNRTHLEISADGNLVIVNHATSIPSIVWSTHIVANTTSMNNTSTSRVVILLNTGNLALMESPTSSVVMWESFDHPADVGIPGAKLGWNKVTGLSRRFISKKSLTDLSLGSYYIELNTNGVMILALRNAPFVTYWNWSSGKLSYKLTPILKANLDMDPRTKGFLDPAYVNNNEEEYFTCSLLNDSASMLAVLDLSGHVRINVWSQPKQVWETIFTQPSDPWGPYGTCGPFTVCNGNSKPQCCACMESFSQRSPQDWELGDPSGGCMRDTPLYCTGTNNMTSSTDIFHPMVRVSLPYYPKVIEEASTQSKCAQACLNDCACTAYSHSNNSVCSIWHGELLNVKQDDGLYNFSEEVLYLCLAAKYLQSLRENNKIKPKVGVIVTAASIIGFVLVMLVLLLVLWRNKLKCWRGMRVLNNQASGGIIAFRYTDLGHATKNFSEKLGAGGFGSVFKGVLSDLTSIAVKRLDGDRQGDKQFRAEVSSIGLMQHINLVKLVGFCSEGDKRLLVYEHMLNGSLNTHLFHSDVTILNWSTRYQIAIGVATGLSYLHQSCRQCIIHCDIKPENILLDASFAPKIADFGLAKFIGRDFSRVLTSFKGTMGYLAPKWLSGIPITPKVDVYSFGMVLFEIISGRRNSPEKYTSKSYHIAYFPVQAISKLHEGDVQSLVDSKLHDVFNLQEAERVCKVACWCIQDSEFDRPTMGEVVRVLEGLQDLKMPPIPRLLAALTECPDVAPM